MSQRRHTHRAICKSAPWPRHITMTASHLIFRIKFPILQIFCMLKINRTTLFCNLLMEWCLYIQILYGNDDLHSWRTIFVGWPTVYCEQWRWTDGRARWYPSTMIARAWSMLLAPLYSTRPSSQRIHDCECTTASCVCRQVNVQQYLLT